MAHTPDSANTPDRPEHSSSAMHRWLQQLQQQLAPAGHRAALLLCGEKHWGRAQADVWLGALGGDSRLNHDILYVSEQISHGLPAKQARTRLGREYGVLVFDAYDDFDVDAFAALSGTLRGGGLLLLLLPDPEHWPALAGSRFLQRASGLMQHPGVYVIRQHQPLPALSPLRSAQRADNGHGADAPFRSIDQQRAVASMQQGLLADRPLVQVLVSDRGRGKSSALGLLAARLVRQGMKTILVTGPRLSTSDPLFQHAHEQLPGAECRRGELRWQQGRISFMAPDALLQQQPAADVLLVDEAAAIPLSLLQALLCRYRALVFATTVHGYEGTGRGFALKFNRVLDADAPGWQRLSMQTPIRWGADDPLEHWLDRLLCMDAELPDVHRLAHIDPQQCPVQRVDQDALLQDEGRLSALFALLVFAHYRTRPSDLKQLLDDESLRLYTLSCQQVLVAALLVSQEGGFEPALADAIHRGERRPQGHLLPQTLSFHGGHATAARYPYARIMRIAVHPSLQGRGLGSRLLQQVVALEQQQDVVAVGTSFGASVELLRFWQRAGFQLLRMGFSRDHASGSHAAVMMRPCNDTGEQLCRALGERFRRYLPSWLDGPLANLSPSMKSYLRQQQQPDAAELSAQDRAELASWLHSQRGMDTCLWPLIKLVKQYPDEVQRLGPVDAALLRGRLLQHRSWGELAAAAGLPGKHQASIRLKQAIARLFDDVST